ncbi:hypothetical protein HK096_001590, partial [Nowakowskiella sp. JEL0078]
MNVQYSDISSPQPSAVTRTSLINPNSQCLPTVGWKTPTLSKTTYPRSHPSYDISQTFEQDCDMSAFEKVNIQEDETKGGIIFFGSTMTALSHGFSDSPRCESGILTLHHAMDRLHFNEDHNMDQLPCSAQLICHLLNSYFNKIHPFYPMVDQADFITKMKEDHHTPEYLFLVNSMCTIVLLQIPDLEAFGLDNDAVVNLRTTFLERGRILLGRLFDFVHIYVVQGLVLNAMS